MMTRGKSYEGHKTEKTSIQLGEDMLQIGGCSLFWEETSRSQLYTEWGEDPGRRGMTSPKTPRQNKPAVQCKARTAESGTGLHRAVQAKEKRQCLFQT